jgi:hypothetical protein
MGDWALLAYASERNRLSVDEQVVGFPCFSGKWLGNDYSALMPMMSSMRRMLMVTSLAD